MKIISWNCNLAFRKKSAHVLKLKPDILVVQECEHPSKFSATENIDSANQFLWFGENKNKGLGILSFNGYTIDLLTDPHPAFRYIIPLRISGSLKANLFAIWAMPDKKKPYDGYIGQIWNAVHFYEQYLEQDSILVGDWNSHPMWDNKRKTGNHSMTSDFLKKHNIASTYHEFRNIPAGQEEDPTLYLLKQKSKPYHIDYCFCTKNLMSENLHVHVGQIEDWLKYSDHMPIIIDGLEN